ncbi:MAG TPA: polysaccharide deacetylase family protein [Anaerolineae bacterium]|nr:polysaccharide deacetylase family protein [Anaerolineae bacterium]
MKIQCCNSMINLALFTVFVSLVFSSCQMSENQARKSSNKPSQTSTTIVSPTPSSSSTLKPIFTTTPANTHTQVPSITPSPTITGTPTPTATWVYHPAGEIEVPILLYHHVSDEEDGNRYYVTPRAFQKQMEMLYERGYKTITVSQLLDVLIYGGELPPKPIVITFDDGHMSVYEDAYPIMEKYGFVGVFYIVANRLESDGFVGVKELKYLSNHGWEIGSHSFSHPDLTSSHKQAKHELLDSRLFLEEKLGIKIQTFAYPYGTIDPFIATKTQNYGYRGAVGLGTSIKHTYGTMYYLSRIEIHGTDNLKMFSSYLPWEN